MPAHPFLPSPWACLHGLPKRTTPATGRGGPPRAALAALALATALTGAAPSYSQVRLPAMGESANAGMPLGEERRLGERVVVEVRRDPAYMDDPVLAAYVRSLWDPLLKAGQRRGEIGPDMQQQFAWDVFLIRDRSINAFALPGGFIGVHLGLIASSASRDELVSVLAHELSHVTQRHIARSIEAAGKQSALGLAAILLGMIAASRSGNPDVARAAISGGQAAMIQGQLNFSRDMEREADRVGQTLMADAGFELAGMPAMFDTLDRAYRLNDSGAFPYLRSHPLTVERIAEAQARAGVTARLQPRQDGEHELMRARARVLMDPSVTALRAHVQTLEQLPMVREAPPATVYAATLAASLLKDPALARRVLARAGAAAQPPEIARWFDLLRLETSLDRQAGAASPAQPAASLPAWPPAPASRWPRPELWLWGRALLEGAPPATPADARFQDVHQALRAWLVQHPQDASLWELLSRFEAARGNRMGMMRASAEAQMANGQAEAALITLQAARTQARGNPSADGVELAVIDARLAEWRRQRASRDGRDGRDGRAQREDRSD